MPVSTLFGNIECWNVDDINASARVCNVDVRSVYRNRINFVVLCWWATFPMHWRYRALDTAFVTIQVLPIYGRDECALMAGQRLSYRHLQAITGWNRKSGQSIVPEKTLSCASYKTGRSEQQVEHTVKHVDSAEIGLPSFIWAAAPAGRGQSRCVEFTAADLCTKHHRPSQDSSAQMPLCCDSDSVF